MSLPLRAAAALAIAASPAALASEQFRLELYPVVGQTLAELRRSLNENGPRDDDGRRFHGYTRWHVGLNFVLVQRGTGCAVDSVEVSLETVITMPEWNRPERIPDHLERAWTDYVTALREHEEGHRRIGARAAQDMERVVAGMAADTDCQTLSSEVRRVADRVIEQAHNDERAYDVRTRHGADEGVKL